MRCLVVFLALVSSSNAQTTLTIKAGIAAEGWCNGFDKGLNNTAKSPTTAQECFDRCVIDYPSTIAVDFWDIDNPGRTAANICFCQDTCDVLLPSKPDGGDGTLYLGVGTKAGTAAPYNLYNIVAETAENGWCRSALDTAVTDEQVANVFGCFAACENQFSEATIIAADYYDRTSIGKGKMCFCQTSCDCLSASLPAEQGGTGYLLLQTAVDPPVATCYTIVAGIGASGWCPGMDIGLEEKDTRIPPATAKECFDTCKAANSSTVAVDFWSIAHPGRTATNVCWCQDSCACTEASKSDGGNGVLFVAGGTAKGASCGRNMKTIVEGNENSMCNQDSSPNIKKEGVDKMYACANACRADGSTVASFLSEGLHMGCYCQQACTCTTSGASGTGPGYLFLPEDMIMPQMCASTSTCGEMKGIYKAASCCGTDPSQEVSFR